MSIASLLSSVAAVRRCRTLPVRLRRLGVLKRYRPVVIKNYRRQQPIPDTSAHLRLTGRVLAVIGVPLTHPRADAAELHAAGPSGLPPFLSSSGAGSFSGRPLAHLPQRQQRVEWRSAATLVPFCCAWAVPRISLLQKVRFVPVKFKSFALAVLLADHSRAAWFD